jgi:hypothetical protein|tara:strand:- start:10655 stop:11107 length:453 start_codon:yes stop_codon:yes gene_type:complete
MTHPVIPKHRTVGINSAGAYQVSGAPFLTGSSFTQTALTADGQQIDFPTMTKSITVINKTDVDIVVHFVSRTGTTNIMDQKRYITLSGIDSAMTFPVKCRKIFISSLENGSSTCTFEMLAELTPVRSEYNLTGSVGASRAIENRNGDGDL